MPGEKGAYLDAVLCLEGQTNREHNSSTSDTPAKTGDIAVNHVSPTQLWLPSDLKVGASKEALRNRTGVNQIRKDKKRARHENGIHTKHRRWFQFRSNMEDQCERHLFVAQAVPGGQRRHRRDHDKVQSWIKDKTNDDYRSNGFPTLRYFWKFRRKNSQPSYRLRRTTGTGPWRKPRCFWK